LPKALNTIHSTTKSRQNWKKNKNTINLSNIPNVEFETLLDPFLKLNALKLKKINYGPSITHKHEHFAKQIH